MVNSRRSLYLLFVGTFFVFLNFNIAQIITPLYIIEAGGTEFFSGLQSTLFYLTAVVLRFYFGPLADRKGNRLTLFIGGFAFMSAPLLFLLYKSVGYILLVRMYQAIGLAAYFSSASALVSALAPQDKIGTYIGFYRLVTMSTLIIGPSIAMKLISEYGYSSYHILGIGVGFLAMVFLHFVKESPKSARATIPNKTSFNMLNLLKDKYLRLIYLSIFLVAICFGLIQTFTAIYIVQSPWNLNSGLFFTLFGIGSIISNLIAGPLSDRRGRESVTFPWMVIMGIGVAVLYFLPIRPWIMYLGSILAGFGYSGAIAVLISWVIDVAPPERRTTALALQDSSIDMGIGLGSFLFGVIISVIGMSWTYGVSGIILLAFAGWRMRIGNAQKIISQKGSH